MVCFEGLKTPSGRQKHGPSVFPLVHLFGLPQTPEPFVCCFAHFGTRNTRRFNLYRPANCAVAHWHCNPFAHAHAALPQLRA